jgi:6-phosphofructokinase
MKNILIGQSGGPTSVINATLVGIVESAIECEDIGKVFGAVHGIEGVINENFIELDKVLKDNFNLELLYKTPAAALGSCRLKLKDFNEDNSEYEKILSIFRKYDIGYYISIGGNDSMDTVYKLSEYLKLKNINDIKIIGAPKTIDNDLVEIDHCPGFGSAAKYIATTFSELRKDCSVYDIPAVTIVEVMGRNAGWLTAASSLSRLNGEKGPDYIYLCEKPFVIESFLNDIREKLKEGNSVIVAVSEGVKDERGKYISEDLQSNVLDSFGHKYISGVGRVLERIVGDAIGCKVRSIELSIMQRCSAHVMSGTDLKESILVGKKAFRCAIEGDTGKMVCIKRVNSNPYKVEFTDVEVKKVANNEKKVPLCWINERGNDIKEEFIEYLKPLILEEVNINYENGIPKYACLF